MSDEEDIKLADEEALKRRFLFRICKNKQELHDWIVIFLALDLPDGMVDEATTSSPMDMVWEVYSKMLEGTDEEFMRVLYFASRDSFKTLSASVIEVLALLHCGRNVAHMAAIQDQALKAQEYVKRSFRRPYLRDFVVGDNERMTKIVRFYNPRTRHSLTQDEYAAYNADEKGEFIEIKKVIDEYVEKDHYVKIVICTMAGANSEHVPLFVIDEVDVVSNPAAYAESQNIPAGRGKNLPITMLTSTRKQAFGLVQKEIDNAKNSGLKIRSWNIIDVTQACLPSRHKPEKPRLKLYVSDEDLRHVDEQTYASMNIKEKETYFPMEGFAGCKNCKLFPACKTRLATHQKSTSSLLKTIPETIGKFNGNSTEMAQAQLLCRKPSSFGLVYQRLNKMVHVITPAQAHEKIFAEAPPGDPKDFTKAQLMVILKETRSGQFIGGIDWGHTHNFVYTQGLKEGGRCFVTHFVTMPGLDPDQMLESCEPFLQYSAGIFPDNADPKMIKLFSKKGFNMKKTEKGAGSVVGGISVVKWLLNPPGTDQPNLYFIHDIGEDPMMNLSINNIAQYHWKKDAAGRITEIPDDDDDDEADALRYMLSGAFKMSTGLVVSKEVEEGPKNVYKEDSWMTKMIQQRLGSASNGSDFLSNVDESQDSSEKQGGKGGGGIIWDI